METRLQLDMEEETLDPNAIVALISQILAVNEQLQHRLAVAEAALQSRSEEVAAYQSEARTDSLTGLPNRRVFNDELDRSLAEFTCYGVTFAVILVDVDHFKSLNDRLGHLAGDAVLADMSRALRSAVRQCDLAARFGGEEFVLLLPHTDAFGARQTAERIRCGIEKHPFSFENDAIPLTVCCGVAHVVPGDDSAALLKRADAALYAAKRGGRNASCWHNGEQIIRLDGLSDTESERSSLSGGLQLSILEQACQDLRRRLLDVMRLERQAGS